MLTPLTLTLAVVALAALFLAGDAFGGWLARR